MDTNEEYSRIIKKLLKERERIASPFLQEGTELTCVFDDATRYYALLTLGWLKSGRVNTTTLLLRIKDNKVWVEQDYTNWAIADELMESGIPREQIVLGFQRPESRPHTDYAVS